MLARDMVIPSTLRSCSGRASRIAFRLPNVSNSRFISPVIGKKDASFEDGILTIGSQTSVVLR
jgi:hypothetical protein